MDDTENSVRPQPTTTSKGQEVILQIASRDEIQEDRTEPTHFFAGDRDWANGASQVAPLSAETI